MVNTGCFFQLFEELLKQPTLKDRLEHTTQHLVSLHQFPNEHDLTKAAQSFYLKLRAADTYWPEVTYYGDITLLKASEGLFLSKALGDNYGLGEVGILFLSPRMSYYNHVLSVVLCWRSTFCNCWCY
jgi:hypothetical protein